jgi:hypothetical protein
MPLARASTHAPHVYEEKFAFENLTYKVFEIGDFSDGISGALGRLAAQSSESKKMLSSIFFTLIFQAEHGQVVKLLGAGDKKVNGILDIP